MDAFCRLCCLESQYYLNIYENGKFGNTFNYEVINYAYNLQIQVDDQLSKYVCRDCTLRIKEFKQWKSMAHAVQLKLLEIQRNYLAKKDVVDNVCCIESLKSCENKEDESHSKMKIKQEVEECKMYTEERDFNLENCMTEKQENRFHSELIIKEEMEKDLENKGLNVDYTNFLPECSRNMRVGSIDGSQPRVGANGHSERNTMGLVNPTIEILSSSQGTTSTDITIFHRKGIKCYFCEKEFAYPSLLEQHMHVHTNDKLHICNFCGKSFSTKGNLKSHFIIHTGERPFKCYVCGKQFSYKGNLAVHYRTHSGERPFQCTVCGKRFTAKNNLMIHQGIHNRDTVVYPRKEISNLFTPFF